MYLTAPRKNDALSVPMLVQCWSTVSDVGPTLNLPCLNVSRSSVCAPALNELWMNLPFVHSTDHCHLLLTIRQTMYVMSRTNLVRDIMYTLMAEYVYDKINL